MSKKYKNKDCAYCGVNRSTGPDHVIARQFFPSGERPDIPKVPACDECNGRKAELENYFTALLPFGSNHPSAQTVLVDDVSRRLDKNRKLARELNFLAGYSWGENDSGLIVPSLELPVDEALLEEMFSMICRGLLHHHYSVQLGDNYFVKVGALTEYGEDIFKREHFPTTKGNVYDDLGPGIFQYVGKQGIDYPELSMWLMRFYAGVTLSDKNGASKSMCFVGLTGHNRALNNANLRIKFESAT